MDRFSYSLNRKTEPPVGWGFIMVSILLGFMLTAIPLPSWAEAWRPCWIALLIFYWCINFPNKTGVIFAFVTGIFLDVFNDGTLGEQALCLSMVSLVATTYSKRFKIYPRLQQGVFVAVLFLIYVFLVRKIQNFDAPLVDGITPVGEVISSAFLWPWLVLLLDEMARRVYFR